MGTDLYKAANDMFQLEEYEKCLDLLLKDKTALRSHPKYLYLAGLSAMELGYYDRSKALFYTAINLFPNEAAPWLYGIKVNGFMGEDVEAATMLQQAIRRFPNDQYIRYANAEHLLRVGRWSEGWIDWEYRTVRTDLLKKNSIPWWDGSSLNGRTLLVAGEQGIGDHVMFARYLKELETKGGNVVVYLQIPSVITRLLKVVAPFSVYDKPEELAVVDHIDCWTMMGSLPLALSNPIPSPQKYLCLPDEKQDGFNVGLCWQGSKGNSRDRFRSVPFDTFKPLLKNKCVNFYSLQKDDTISGLPSLAFAGDDMYDVACSIAKLDLVITVDTSIGHVAGAMGKPVWIMIARPSDWRWGAVGTQRSVWYTSDRLFWQKKPGAWPGVINEIDSALKMAVVGSC